MEIIVKKESSVKFSVPSGVSTATFKVFKNDEQVGSEAAAQITNGVASCHIPYAAVTDETDIVVVLSFDKDGYPYSTTKKVSVVTPLLESWEIKEIHPNATDREVVKIEAAVRHVINAHTGQSFGKFIGKKSVHGGGSEALPMPSRLLELKSVNGREPHSTYDIGASGWVLYNFPWGVPPIKADYYGLHMHTNGVIHNPNNVKLGQWSKDKVYDIDGVWGWEEVPAQVAEAAKLLVNDYACADASYRDRYLSSMTAADWRVSFASGAFRATGNARADLLLDGYVLSRGWMII